MTPLLPSQRAAEDFDDAVEGTASTAVSERYARLLGAVEVLQAQPQVLPRAEFAADLRSRLMTAAETDLVPAPPVRRTETRAHKRNRRLGTAVAAVVIVGGTAGMAAAAQGSLPGQSLYPIKRGIEQAGLAFHRTDVGKGNALLGQAATRLDEVRALQAEDHPDKALIADTIDSFNDAADAGSKKLFTAYQTDGDDQAISNVRTFTTEQMPVVASITDQASAKTDELLRDAADTLADIDQQAQVLCGACSAAKPVSPPAALSSGAAAATVNSLLARPVAQARADADAAQVKRAAQIAKLQAAAEDTAGRFTAAQRKKFAEVAAGLSAPTTTTTSGAPVTSTLTRDGKLLPSTSGGAAVKDLVSGVTGTVSSVTTGVTGGKTPLDPLVKKLTDTIDGVTNQLVP